MQTIIIDILNDKALRLLQDLELLQLIRVRTESQPTANKINWAEKYKGSMTKQPLIEVDNQLNELRNQWQ